MTLPLGISQLSELSQVTVSQQTSSWTKNRYKVLAPDGSVLFNAREESSMLDAICSQEKRPFYMHLFNADNQEVIMLHRPNTFLLDKMYVRVGGQLVSVVRQKLTLWDRQVTVNDAMDQPMFKLKGHTHFQVLTSNQNKMQIGTVLRQWTGCFDLCMNIDHYKVEFPLALHVNFKAALIGACILIDYLYFES